MIVVNEKSEETTRCGMGIFGAKRLEKDLLPSLLAISLNCILVPPPYNSSKTIAPSWCLFKVAAYADRVAIELTYWLE